MTKCLSKLEEGKTYYLIMFSNGVSTSIMFQLRNLSNLSIVGKYWCLWDAASSGLNFAAMLVGLLARKRYCSLHVSKV